MITFEKTSQLREQTGVSFTEAKEALEAAGGDLLEAVILLERQGKVCPPPGGGYYHTGTSGPQSALPPGQAPGGKQGPSELKKLWETICKWFERGNRNQFVVKRQAEKVVSMPINVLIILVLFVFWLTLPLLVVGLFFGCTYKFEGQDLNGGEAVNKVMDNVAEAAENVKQTIKADHQNRPS